MVPFATEFPTISMTTAAMTDGIAFADHWLSFVYIPACSIKAKLKATVKAALKAKPKTRLERSPIEVFVKFFEFFRHDIAHAKVRDDCKNTTGDCKNPSGQTQSPPQENRRALGGAG